MVLRCDGVITDPLIQGGKWGGKTQVSGAVLKSVKIEIKLNVKREILLYFLFNTTQQKTCISPLTKKKKSMTLVCGERYDRQTDGKIDKGR